MISLMRPLRWRSPSVVEPALVAGAEPAVRERGRVRLGVGGVAREHVDAADRHLARCVPAGSSAPSLVEDRDLRPGGGAHRPRQRARRVEAGCSPSGAAASVIPYASSTGTPSACSSPSSTGTGSADDDERTKRRPASADRSFWSSRGTRQDRLQHGRNGREPASDAAREPSRRSLTGWKPGVHATEPPARSEASSAATSPWMWNSGITLRQRSDSRSSARRRRRPPRRRGCGGSAGRASAATSFPRCGASSATSSGAGAGRRRRRRRASGPGEGERSRSAGGRSGASSTTSMPRLAATSRTGLEVSRPTTTRRAPRSPR